MAENEQSGVQIVKDLKAKGFPLDVIIELLVLEIQKLEEKNQKLEEIIAQNNSDSSQDPEKWITFRDKEIAREWGYDC